MKKLLLTLFIIFSISQLKAQIPGIIGYHSNGPNYPWVIGTTINWPISDCSHGFLTILLEQPDEMFLEHNGIVIQSFGSTSFININKFIIDLYYSNIFTLRGTSSGVLCSLQTHRTPSQLTNIQINTYDNNISGDTLTVCSEFNENTALTIDYEFDYNFQPNDRSIFINDQFAFIYINGVKQASKILSELTIKTGDTLQVKRESGNINSYQCFGNQWEPELTTLEYILKVTENPKVAITSVLDGETIICPGDSVILGQTVGTTKNFVWYNQSAYYSSQDTTIITKPGQYRLIENNDPKGSCAALSYINTIVKGRAFKGYVNGYVRES